VNHASIRPIGDSVEDLSELLTWNYLVEPGDRVANKLRSSLGNRLALEKLLRRDTAAIPELTQDELSAAFDRWKPRFRHNIATEMVAMAKRFDMQLLLPTDSLWPESLGDLGLFAPMLLWYRGNPESFKSLDRTLSVVGSRTSSSYGQQVTSDVVSCAVEAEATVVSGGALGVDAVAHRSTLAQGGRTLSVMAGSLDNLYPAGNWDLFEKIGHSGLLLSEMAPNSKPTRWRFLQRNRIIAALGNALVVTEAGWRSGSMNTATHCAELGRRVFAVPGPITSPSSAGCNRLIRENLAELLLDPLDLAAELGWSSYNSASDQQLGALELRTYDFLTDREQTLASISAAAGLTSGELAIALGSLQLSNRAEKGLKGGWKRTK
jgi:DNA processing protein